MCNLKVHVECGCACPLALPCCCDRQSQGNACQQLASGVDAEAIDLACKPHEVFAPLLRMSAQHQQILETQCVTATG